MSEYENWFSVRFPNIQATIDQSNDQESKLLKLACKEVWQHQQAEIDDLRSQLNNMEICYIQMKKERDELHSATDKALTHVKRQTECFRDLKTDATDMQTKNWWQAKVQILNPIRRMLEAALRGASD